MRILVFLALIACPFSTVLPQDPPFAALSQDEKLTRIYQLIEGLPELKETVKSNTAELKTLSERVKDLEDRGIETSAETGSPEVGFQGSTTPIELSPGIRAQLNSFPAGAPDFQGFANDIQKPPRDQDPFGNAKKFKTKFEEALAGLPTAVPPGFDAQLKQATDSVLSGLAGSPKKKWEPLINQMLAYLREGQGYDPTNVDQRKARLQDCIKGLDLIIKVAEGEQDKKPAGTSSSTQRAASSGSFGTSGTSLAAVHHARVMASISRRHERRGYRIQRIYAR